MTQSYCSLLSICLGSPLICDNDRCANVMWDLSVALGGQTGARAGAVAAVRDCVLTVVTAAIFNRTVFASNSINV